MDSGFSPQRSITASRRSVVFEIACLHNRNNKHRLTFCHVSLSQTSAQAAAITAPTASLDERYVKYLLQDTTIGAFKVRRLK